MKLRILKQMVSDREWGRLVPWWALRVLDRLGWCWAGLVWWKHGSRFPDRIQTCVHIIEIDGKPSLTCYCGFWGPSLE